MTAKKQPTTLDKAITKAQTVTTRPHTLRLLQVDEFGDLDIMFNHSDDTHNCVYFRENGCDYATFLLNQRQANALLEWLQDVVPLMTEEPEDPTAPLVRVVT